MPAVLEAKKEWPDVVEYERLGNALRLIRELSEALSGREHKLGDWESQIDYLLYALPNLQENIPLLPNPYIVREETTEHVTKFDSKE